MQEFDLIHKIYIYDTGNFIEVFFEAYVANKIIYIPPLHPLMKDQNKRSNVTN